MENLLKMEIYQHFRKEEYAFIDKVLEWKTTVEEQYKSKLTDFLDPREQEIIKQVIGTTSEITVKFFGGTDYVERKRAYIYPTFFACTSDEFQLSYFQINYPSKFVSIDHRQVLGSLMSQGLKRAKFGDILMNQDTIQLIIATEISDFVKINLKSIGRSNITLTEISQSQLISTEETWSETATTVSSLRLDAIIAGIYNLSRQKVQSLIQAGHVKVNWKVIENTSFECNNLDVISVRGYGRSKLIAVEGKTKKDKWRIVVGKQK